MGISRDFRLVSFWHFLFALRCTDLVDSGFEHLAGCAKHLANQSDCSYIRIALRALKVSYSDVGEEGVAVNCEKRHNFS